MEIIVVVVSCLAALVTAQNRAGSTVAAEPLVIGETFTIATAALKEVRRINVYAPPGYAASG